MAVGDFARALPPPDKLKRAPNATETDGNEYEPGEEDADEDEAAGVSMMQELMDVLGAKGDAAEACRALDAYLEARGFVRK